MAREIVLSEKKQDILAELYNKGIRELWVRKYDMVLIKEEPSNIGMQREAVANFNYSKEKVFFYEVLLFMGN